MLKCNTDMRLNLSRTLNIEYLLKSDGTGGEGLLSFLCEEDMRRRAKYKATADCKYHLLSM